MPQEEGERQPIVTADSMEVRQPPNVSRLPGAQAVEGRAENTSGPLAKCVDIDAAMKERHLRMHGGMMFGDENPADSGNVCQEHAARCTDCGAPAVEMVLQQPRCALHADEVARRVDFDAQREGK